MEIIINDKSKSIIFHFPLLFLLVIIAALTQGRLAQLVEHLVYTVTHEKVFSLISQ